MDITPYPSQHAPIAAVNKALERHNVAINASETGTGKTVMTLATCKKYGLRPAVVCPKVVIPSWKRHCAMYDIEPLFVTNWERCIRGQTEGKPYLTRNDFKRRGRGKKRSPTESVYNWSLPDNSLLIFDEAHRGREPGTKSTALIEAAGRNNEPMVLLSATLADSPMHFRALGPILGLFPRAEWSRWAHAHGCRKSRWHNGLEWNSRDPASDLRLLHHGLFPEHGGYLLRSQMEEFPETFITADAYDCDWSAAWIGSKRCMPTLKELGDEVSNAMIEAIPITQDLRLQQYVEYLKLPVFHNLATDSLAEGKSVVLFVKFHRTMDALESLFPDACIVRGGQNDQLREKHIAEFQANKRNVAIVQIAAGGVGVELDDKHGGHPRVAFLSPEYNPVSMGQALGRIHRADSKSPSSQTIIFAAGTIEEDVLESVQRRLNHTKMLTHGEMWGDVLLQAGEDR